nr:transposase zinc-binding domain-containing protein [uncultured Rhodopila sp.]
MADVFRRFGPAFRDQHGASLSSAQRHAMTAIETCRTVALGGHVEQCGDCGHRRVSYNSCLMGKISNGESRAAPLRSPAVFERHDAASHPHLVPINPDLPGATADSAASGR